LTSAEECRIGRFTLRPHRQLLDGDVPVAIGRKALDLLSVLAKADGALVTKDELMAAVWPNVIVDDNAIQVHIAALRKALGEDADLLTTARGLGYRLVVTDMGHAALRTAPESVPEPTQAEETTRRRSRFGALALGVVTVLLLAVGAFALLQGGNRSAQAATPPTIAVLAFQPADSSENARLLADGLARSVASSLSRYDVTVVAASSSCCVVCVAEIEMRKRERFLATAG